MVYHPVRAAAGMRHQLAFMRIFSMIGLMKNVSPERQKEIAEFSAKVRAAGYKMIPREGDNDRRDADRIRALAAHLGLENPGGLPSPTLKTWWYGQNAPARLAAQLIAKQLISAGQVLRDVEFGAGARPRR